VRSGALNLDRGLSRGEQSYDTDESLWPVSEPIEKVESKWQTSGELKYVGDIPTQQGDSTVPLFCPIEQIVMSST
jgi:hypothetical protein